MKGHVWSSTLEPEMNYFAVSFSSPSLSISLVLLFSTASFVYQMSIVLIQ
jgi:hypothetical protein